MKLVKSLFLALSLVGASVAADAAPTAPTATPAAAAPSVATAPAPVIEPGAVPAPAPSPTPLVFVSTAKPDPEIGQPVPAGYTLPVQVTPNGKRALWMHDYVLMPVIIFTSLLVLGLLAWVVIRYRASANPTPGKTTHNTLVEVIWTLVPVLILVAIAIPSIGLLAAQFKTPPKDAVTLKAIGNQWYWNYQYPDHGDFELTANMLPDAEAKKRGEPRLLAADERVVLPVGVPIRVLVTSNDVIHSWAVPAFWAKMDAVPGRINELSFTIERPGIYYGQCSELCGARHAFMPIAVEAVSPEQFARWVASKGGTMPSAKPAPAAAAEVAPAAEGGAPETANATDAAEEPAANATDAPAAANTTEG